MNEFTTVFEVSAETYGMSDDKLLMITIGIVALGTGIAGVFFPQHTKGIFEKKLAGPLFLIAWGGIWLLALFLTWKMNKFDMNLLLKDYRNGQSKIAEGVVHVTHEQPFNGHSAGDKISVGGHEFEVNPPTGSPGYKRTISHGGALHEGVFARLHYYDGNYLNGTILKVEIRNDKDSCRWRSKSAYIRMQNPIAPPKNTFLK